MILDVLTVRSEIEPYVDDVRAAGDSERAAFGFLRASAYDDFVFQGRMFIAVERHSRSMMGYILFGGTMPQGRIFQTWTAPKGRSLGVGRRLVSAVIARLEAQHYLSVRADVAQDLDEANAFYGRLGFEVIKARPGKTKGRKINVRVRELATPSLIELAMEDAESHVCLPVALPSGKTPLYVLDLNVLFDVARRRTQASYSGKVFGAGLDNDLRLAVAAELVSELQRNTDPSAPDPILEFAASLPRLPVPPKAALDERIRELAPIIFPAREKAGNLTVQDRSDLVHLATAVHECATGFITSEKAILRAAEYLREWHSLEVISPEALGMTLGAEASQKGAINILARGAGVRAQAFEEADHQDAESFLKARNLTTSETRALLAAGTGTLPRRRHLIRVDETVAAFAAWDAPRAGGGQRELQMYVDEGSPAASLAADHLVHLAIADVGSIPPSIFELHTKPGSPSVRRAALAGGFFRSKAGTSRIEVLQKVAIGRVVTEASWASLRDSVHRRAGMLLPKSLPSFRSGSQPIEIKSGSGETMTLAFDVVERLLSPLLLALPGRPAVMLPITQRYAEELFSGSTQPTFLSGREAVLRSIRGYVSGRGSYNAIPEGGLAVFYESGRGGGRKAATAVARVVRKYLMLKDSAAQLLSEKAVLEVETVKSMGRTAQVVVTEFEDVMILKNPVPLTSLRQWGCVGGANLVTASPLSSERLIKILQAGDAHA